MQLKQWKWKVDWDWWTQSILLAFYVETTRLTPHGKSKKQKMMIKDKQGQQSPHKYMKQKRKKKGIQQKAPYLSHRHVYLQFHGPPFTIPSNPWGIAKGTLRQTSTPQYCYSFWKHHLHLWEIIDEKLKHCFWRILEP